MSDYAHKLTVDLDVPNATLGDYATAQGAIFDAATGFIDWERLHNGEADAISPPGLVLLQIAARLPH